MSTKLPPLSQADYERLANFRYTLRCFLEFSESVALREGVTPQQHQALLVIRASTNQQSTVGHLASRLRIKHHSAVELAQRLEVAGLIHRETSQDDGRVVILRLTPPGAAKLKVLTEAHRAELHQIRSGMLELAGDPNSLP